MKDLPSLGEFLESLAERFDAADLFYGHGTSNAWDEAVYLVFCALSIPFDSGDDVMQRPVTLSEQSCVSALADRRIVEHVPVAYLVGEAWFAGLPFKVSPDVLIPRSPIAELIQQHFATLLPAEPSRILDLCTGSGCIGIAMALEFPLAEVDISDISDAALALARQNVSRHALDDRVNVLASDLFAALTQAYDVIVSNPPYVSQEEVNLLPDEYRHEPVLGLVSDDDGLAIPLQILREAPQYLSADGVLVLEVGYSHEALSARLPQVPFLWLEFANGGEGICMLTRQQLLEHHAHFV